MLQKTVKNRLKNRLQKMGSAWLQKKQKRRKTAIITGLLIPNAEVGKSEVNKHEYAITEYMPANECPLGGRR